MQRSEMEKEEKKMKGIKWYSGFGKWMSSLVVDPRQILAGFLTFTMFLMLAHMIKRDHFDSPPDQEMTSPSKKPKLEKVKIVEQTFESVAHAGLWKDNSSELKPCWSKPKPEDSFQTDGYVTFSLTDGPEYHIAQIADAVVVAKGLGATLVLPDIRGSKLGDKRDFEDVYDAEKVMDSLDGIVRVVKEPHRKLSAKNLAVIKVQNRVTEDHVVAHIEPLYREKGNIRLVTHFSSVNVKKTKDKRDVDSITCIAMFGLLELQPRVQGVVDTMLERLQTLSRKSDGHFVAVDLRVDVLEKKGCQQNDGSGPKDCYNAREVAVFLRKLGFGKDTVVYLTQSRWDISLDALKQFFPKTYTKESIMPMDKKKQYLNKDAPTMEEIIDFYICSESDVFVPAISGLFYANVAGKRIASGKTQILVPSDISGSSASPDNFVSHYITKQSHFAYSCFC